jgi:nucleotidyltransferase/DNA polymerase involved in DNA repair
MDAFFAAVEQLDYPEYRGKPVIVGSDPKGGKGRGVVATASYEARKFGVFSAMPISQAWKRCPHGVYVRGRSGRYSEVSRQVMKVMQEFSPVIEKISIDEAFMDITGSVHLFGGARSLAVELKRRIRNDIHLTASVGIAPNKFLAKIASDLEKPDGLTAVEPGGEKAFLADLPISRLWGVGKKTEEALHRMGLRKIGEVAAMSQITLHQRFGKWGTALWNLANGRDDRPVVGGHVQKSISQEITFDEDTGDEEEIEGTLFHLAESLARLMRKQSLLGKTITLKVRLEDFSTFTRSRTLSEFVNSSALLRTVSVEMYRQFNRQGQKVRLLGIGVSQLNSEVGEQLSLFDQETQLNDKLTDLMDVLQNKFGVDSVKRASLLQKSNRNTFSEISRNKGGS